MAAKCAGASSATRTCSEGSKMKAVSRRTRWAWRSARSPWRDRKADACLARVAAGRTEGIRIRAGCAALVARVPLHACTRSLRWGHEVRVHGPPRRS
eukprot:IDg18265t1